MASNSSWLECLQDLLLREWDFDIHEQKFCNNGFLFPRLNYKLTEWQGSTWHYFLNNFGRLMHDFIFSISLTFFWLNMFLLPWAFCILYITSSGHIVVPLSLLYGATFLYVIFQVPVAYCHQRHEEPVGVGGFPFWYMFSI